MPNNYINVARSTADTSLDDYVFYAKYEGEEGDKVFTDLKGNLATVTGNPKITRARVLAGVSSLDLTAVGTYLAYNNIAGLAFRTGDFCIEGRTRFTVAPTGGNSRGLLQISTSVGGLQQAFGNAAINFRQSDARWEIYAGGSTLISSAGPSINTDIHYVLERWNGVTTLYADGVAVCSRNDTFDYTGTHLALGGIYTMDHLGLGYHDEVKITRFARFKGAFTPPPAP